MRYMKPDSVAVIIATFGDRNIWDKLAVRAKASAAVQTHPADHVLRLHGPTLAQARNMAVQHIGDEVEWLVFLDADDTLDPRYIEAMLAGTGDLRQPATLGVTDGVEDPHPVMIPTKPLSEGNYLVIGTMVRREQFLAVGGFQEWPAWEDWDLWWRCVDDGAVVGQVPDAIYRVTVHQGRNEAVANDYQLLGRMQAAHREWLAGRA